MLDPARHDEQGQHWILPADGEFWSENLLDVQAVGPARKHRPSPEHIIIQVTGIFFFCIKNGEVSTYLKGEDYKLK
jgi:hypothetical protein